MSKCFLIVVLLFATATCPGNTLNTISSKSLSSYIVNGEPAAPGEFPSQLSLQVNGSHICGAVIISSTWALTGAQCVIRYLPVFIHLVGGTNDLEAPGLSYRVKDYTFHASFDPLDSWLQDIAVVSVFIPFDYDVMKPISLPEQGQVFPELRDATVVGWGRQQIGGPLSSTLQKATVEITRHDDCRLSYEANGTNVYDSQICAGAPEGGTGSCSGDTGGPLIVDSFVIGLVSWGNGCGSKEFPYIYTRVASFRDWIREKSGV